MASTPGKTATDSLKPRVGGDGEHETLAEGMEEGAEPALAEAMGHGEPQRQDDGNLEPENRIPRRKGQEKKRAEKNHSLKELKEDKGAPSTVERGVEVLGESAPEIPKVVVHATLNQGQGMAGVGAVVVLDAEARGPHFPGQGNVLDQMAADRRVPTDFVIGCAAKEKELSIGGAK